MDDFIGKLVPLLSKGDIIIDGGNSEHQDTTRRCREMEKKGILYVGSGVSGGEEGARYGPSLMPGGHIAAWPHIKDIFQVCYCFCEHTSVRPKFGIGRKYRPKPLVSVSVSEPKLLQPKPKLQYIDFSEITLSTYVHVLHGKSEIT